MVLTLLRMGPVVVRGDMAPLYPAAAAMPLQGVPLTAATSQGVPLTAASSWPGGFTVPAHRLPYNDPYTSAYVSMLTSMYGLSIAV